MIEVLQRSWRITKLSFRVILQDKEMLLFPFLGGLFSLLFSAAILLPGVILGSTGAEGQPLGPLEYLLIAVTYFGLAFIATFFNVCVVYTTKTRFDGGDATFMESIRFAMSRLHLIAAWSAVAATVGLILRALDQAADRMGGAGEIVINIMTSLLGMAWSVITIFVVPAMVYHELGPLDAIKRSASTLKRTWGESLVRHFGLGVVQFLFLLPGILLAMLLFPSLGSFGVAGIVIAVLVVGAYLLAVGLVFSVANSVFNTALYVYADHGTLPSGFDRETMDQAFRYRQRRGGGF